MYILIYLDKIIIFFVITFHYKVITVQNTNYITLHTFLVYDRGYFNCKPYIIYF